MKTNNFYNKNLQPNANKLRHNMTKAEACLWKYALRANGLGVPFKRERPIGRFIADLVCLPLKLVIEVDGITHLYEETQIKDAQKDKELKEMGFEVLRFQDNVILNNINFVIGVIQDKIEELKKIHPQSPPMEGVGRRRRVHPLNPPPAGEINLPISPPTEELQQADAEDLEELKQLEEKIKKQ